MKGHISILRVSPGHGDQFIQIQIEDAASGCRFIETNIALKDFAEAITGIGHLPCEFEVRGLEVLGKVREVKREVLPAINSELHRSCREAAAREIVSRHEQDGWVGHWRDLLNSNNSERLVDGREGRRVTFERFIDPQLTENQEQEETDAVR